MKRFNTKYDNPTSDEQDVKNMRKAALIKMIAMGVFLVVVIIFGSIAWFTSSKEVEGTGMQMTASYNGFNLQVENTGNIGFSPLYSFLEDSIHGNTGTITNDEENGQYVQWRMTDGDDQLKPGSEGSLEFTVISTGADISSLHYSIKLRTFTEQVEVSEEEENGKTVQVQNIIGLNEITDESGSVDERKGSEYLKHHILFFKNRTGSVDDGYQYSGFISDPSDFELTLNDGKATIYWVWVNTFGQLALTSADSTYIKSNLPVLNASGETNDRSSVTAYMTSNADKIFNGSQNYSALISTLYSKRSSEESYQDEYDKLSDGYNSADQTIGGYLNYVLIQLTASPPK